MANLHIVLGSSAGLSDFWLWFATLVWQLPENWKLDDAGSAGSSDPSSLGVTRAKYPVQASRTNQLASVTAAAFCKPANQPNIVRHRGNKGMYCLAPMWQHCRKQQQYATIMFGIWRYPNWEHNWEPYTSEATSSSHQILPCSTCRYLSQSKLQTHTGVK